MAIIVVDRIGRRILLILSGVIMSITIFGLGTYFYLDENQKSLENISWLPLVSLFRNLVFRQFLNLELLSSIKIYYVEKLYNLHI